MTRDEALKLSLEAYRKGFIAGQTDMRYRPEEQRTWVGLTDELLRKMHHEDQFGLFCDYDEFEQIAQAIEAKLKEKNT